MCMYACIDTRDWCHMSFLITLPIMCWSRSLTLRPEFNDLDKLCSSYLVPRMCCLNLLGAGITGRSPCQPSSNRMLEIWAPIHTSTQWIFDLLIYFTSCLSTLFLLYYLIIFYVWVWVFGCMCMCMYGHTPATVFAWSSEGNLWELILFFYHVDPQDQTHVGRFGSKCLYLMHHPAGLSSNFLRESLVKPGAH